MSRPATRYAEGWREFSRWVREVRAGGRCECTGECGLHPPVHVPENMTEVREVQCGKWSRRCIEHDGEPARYMKRGTIVMLTVAHLNAEGGPCQCDPRCAIPDHILAMCQRCHLRYDGPRHQANARDTRFAPAGEQQPLHFPGAGSDASNP